MPLGFYISNAFNLPYKTNKLYSISLSAYPNHVYLGRLVYMGWGILGLQILAYK